MMALQVYQVVDVCRYHDVRYDVPQSDALLQRLAAEDEYILLKLKGPNYSLARLVYYQ